MSDEDAVDSRAEDGARGPVPGPPSGMRALRCPSPWERTREEKGLPRGIEELRSQPECGEDRWLLVLIPAMVERIESAEWYGSPELLARFLVAEFRELPPSLSRPEVLLEALGRALPMLREWGFVVRIDPHPAWGRSVQLDGTAVC